MTRINVAVNPRWLTDEHLLAEHREIKRLPMVYAKCKNSHDVPDTFCLGTGHVKFFMNKLQYAYKRYQAIHEECLARGFNVADYSQNFENASDAYNWHDYIPNRADLTIVRQRIRDKIQMTTKQLHYFGSAISKQMAMTILGS